jgi:hypothetical protein
MRPPSAYPIDMRAPATLEKRLTVCQIDKNGPTERSHTHSIYEVHFKSNHHADQELKYCVSVYCQQGWDPTTSKTSVNLMSDSTPGKAGAAAAHGAHCVSHMQPVKPGAKR